MKKKMTIKSTTKRLSNLPPREKMSNDDIEFYSEIGAALLRNELELLVVNEQWVLGIISLASMLDFVGKTKLIWKYKGTISTRRISKYTFHRTIHELFNSKVIGAQSFKTMLKIKQTRNNFAHNLLRLFSLSHKPNPSLEKLIKKGITIIETLLAK